MNDADPTYWEDKFLRLREENQALKEKCDDLEDAHSRMKTRNSFLEAPLYRRSSTLGSATSIRSGSQNRRVAKENSDLITELFHRNDQLRRDQKALQDKHKNAVAAAGKLKREVQTLKLRSSGSSRRAGDGCARNIKSASSSREIRYGVPDENALVVELQQRLFDAERQIDSLRDLKRADPNAKNASEQDAATYEDQVKRLAETTSELHSLKARYDRLESKAHEQSELQGQALDKLESYKANIRQLELDLQKARQERDEAKAEVGQLADQQKEIAELTEQNRSLEERLTQLCGAPFRSANTEDVRRYEEEIKRIKSKSQAQEAMILSLTDEAQRLHVTLESGESSVEVDLDASTAEQPSID